jgi:hypothetical protein
MFHGQKRYLQVLLDPNRADLLDALAAERDVRTTALVREQVYEALERSVPPEVYAEALSRDVVVREDAINRQVDGRRKRKPT